MSERVVPRWEKAYFNPAQLTFLSPELRDEWEGVRGE